MRQRHQRAAGKALAARTNAASSATLTAAEQQGAIGASSRLGGRLDDRVDAEHQCAR